MHDNVTTSFLLEDFKKMKIWTYDEIRRHLGYQIGTPVRIRHMDFRPIWSEPLVRLAVLPDHDIVIRLLPNEDSEKFFSKYMRKISNSKRQPHIELKSVVITDRMILSVDEINTRHFVVCLSDDRTRFWVTPR